MNRLRSSFLLFPFILLACSGGAKQSESETATSGDRTGVTDQEILIGSWGPLTGPAAPWGNVIKGMDAYFDLVNEQGGIHGRKIRFLYKDDQYNPSRTVAAVRQMVQLDEVFAFVGGIGTAPNLNVMPYIVENQVPWVSPCSGATHWAFPKKDRVFSTFTLYFDEAQVQVDHIVDQLGIEKLGVVYQNDDFGMSGVIAARAALEKKGLSFVAEVSTEVQDTDLSSQVARLKDAGAEAVLLWVMPKHGTIALGTAAKMGFRPQWVSSSVMSDMEMMHKLTQGLWEGVIFSFYGLMPTSDDPQIQTYRAALARKYPDVSWGAFSASGFLFAEPLVEGLRKAGPELTRENFVAAMEAMQDFQGIGPKMSFSQNNHQAHRSLFLVRCQSATEYEKLTDFVHSTADIQDLIDRLQAH